MRLRFFLLWLVFVAPVISGGSAASAQSYPVKPIRLIVPWPPGATADTAARVVTHKVGESFGQQVVVDNRAGGSTIIGTEIAAKSARDGYTLLLAPFNFGANPSLFAKLPYDSAKDFRAVALLGTSPIVLVVNPRVSAHTVKELISLAAAAPGKLNYATAGNGSSNHLAGELFKSLTGVDITHVPYKGGAPAATAVVAGEVPLIFSALSSAITHVRAGRLRALAVASQARSAALPAVPTMREAGITGGEVGAWHGVLAPTGTPSEIVNQLNAEIAKALVASDVKQRLVEIGFDPVPGSPAQFDRFIKSEISRWAKVIRAAKISPS